MLKIAQGAPAFKRMAASSLPRYYRLVNLGILPGYRFIDGRWWPAFQSPTIVTSGGVQ